MILDENRPKVGIKASVLKYYVKKNTRELTLSKNHLVTLLYSEYCREDIGALIHRNLLKLIPNEGSSIPYQLKTLPYYEANGLKETGEASILIENIYEINDKDLLRFLNTTLGTLDIILHHGELDKKRRELIPNLHDRLTADEGNFLYKVLSNQIVKTPYSLSLFLGLARDCYMLLESDPFHVRKLFEKVSEEEINAVIDNMDYEKAYNIFMNIVIPFFNSDGVKGYCVAMEEECYDEDEENYDCDIEYETYHEGSDSINILSNRDILDNIRRFIEDYPFMRENIIENWGTEEIEYGVGIAKYDS